jgi:molybdopterin synthase catalytic subunit
MFVYTVTETLLANQITGKKTKAPFWKLETTAHGTRRVSSAAK